MKIMVITVELIFAVIDCIDVVECFPIILYGSSGFTMSPTPPYLLCMFFAGGASLLPSSAWMSSVSCFRIHVSHRPGIAVSISIWSTICSFSFSPLVLNRHTVVPSSFSVMHGLLLFAPVSCLLTTVPIYLGPGLRQLFCCTVVHWDFVPPSLIDSGLCHTGRVHPSCYCLPSLCIGLSGPLFMPHCSVSGHFLSSDFKSTKLRQLLGCSGQRRLVLL